MRGFFQTQQRPPPNPSSDFFASDPEIPNPTKKIVENSTAALNRISNIRKHTYTHVCIDSRVRAYVAWATESRLKAMEKSSRRKSDESEGIIALSLSLFASFFLFYSLLLNRELHNFFYFPGFP